MQNQRRIQLDLNDKEFSEFESLMEHAGMKTKRELVVNAITLFKWAANEMLYGRAVASVTADGTIVKHLEMPALTSFSTTASALDRLLPSAETLRERAKRPVSPRGAELDQADNLREE